MKKDTWTSHRIIVPDHVGYILAADQAMMNLEAFGGLAEAMTNAALEYLREHDLIIETRPEPVPDNVIQVDFNKPKGI